MAAWIMLRGGMPVLPGVVGMFTIGFLLAVGIQMVAPNWFGSVQSFFAVWGMAIAEFQQLVLWPFAGWVYSNVPVAFVNDALGVYMDIMQEVNSYFYFSGYLDSHTFIGGFTILYVIFELVLFWRLGLRIARKEGRILDLQQTH